MLQRNASRKRLNSATKGSYTDLVAGRTKNSNPSEGLAHNLAHNVAGSLTPDSHSAPQAIYYSTAGYYANDPHTDQQIMQAHSSHLFAAVVKSGASARGGNYLRQHLYGELRAQLPKHDNNAHAALHASVRQLDADFRNLHPICKSILQQVQLSVAYVDLDSQQLLVASNGGCRCVLGRSTQRGDVSVVTDVGLEEESEEGSSEEGKPLSKVATQKLDRDVDTIILGSTGFWREVAPFKAVLRVHHFYKSVPYASKGSASASLINYAMYGITKRMKNHKDRRMLSLRSVTNLVSLHAGDRSQFKWGFKQPVRRRRGDVHDDLTAVVFKMDWDGRQASFKECPRKIRSPKTLQIAASSQPVKRSHWDLVRMVLVDFRRDSNHHTRQAWYSLVDQLVEQKRKAQQGKLLAEQTSEISLKASCCEQGTQKSDRSSADSSKSTMSYF